MYKFGSFLWAFVLLTLTYQKVNSRSVPSHKLPVGIVNGTNAEEGEFPYLVQIIDNYKRFTCGGSIIGDKWILTAGHCVTDVTLERIVYGTNHLYIRTEAPNTTIKIQQTYRHPKYTEIHTEVGAIPIYDVGILELVEPIIFSEKAKSIKLAKAGEVVPLHVNGTLAGWGMNDTDEILLQHYLQKIQLQLLPDEQCRKRISDYGGADIFNPIHDLCSDDYWNGECYGDSGSPFVINGIQYGLVSWSLKPCGSNPGTYSRLPNPDYRSFIKNITGI